MDLWQKYVFYDLIWVFLNFVVFFRWVESGERVIPDLPSHIRNPVSPNTNTINLFSDINSSSHRDFQGPPAKRQRKNDTYPVNPFKTPEAAGKFNNFKERLGVSVSVDSWKRKQIGVNKTKFFSC